MKICEINAVLNVLPKVEPALKSHKGSTFSFIVNEPNNNNIGYDITLDNSSWRVIKFKRDPYKTNDIMSGYEKLTMKQVILMRNHVIKHYYPELDYLLS